jgi:E3 ubiquitin-protein ligase RNF14
MVISASASASAATNYDDCVSLQAEEWEVLQVRCHGLCDAFLGSHRSSPQSIYPDFVSDDVANSAFKLEIPVDLGDEPRLIAIHGSGEASSASSPSAGAPYHEARLSSLPPILLHISLPRDYPISSPPQLLSIHATHHWVPADVLRKRLLESWRPGEGILCQWIEELNSGNFITGGGRTISYVSPRFSSRFSY